MNGVDVVAGVGLGGGLDDLGPRMAEEDAERLSARVAGRTNDADGDHWALLANGSTVRRYGSSTVRLYGGSRI
jgi:hypothetical protein